MRFPEWQNRNSFPALVDDVRWYNDEQSLAFVRAQQRPRLWFGSVGPVITLAVDRSDNAMRIPGIHTITSDGYPDTYSCYLSILSQGFNVYPSAMNVFLSIEDATSQAIRYLYDAEGIGNGKVTQSRYAETNGDRYQLHLYSGFSPNFTPYNVENDNYGYGTVGNCPPQDIDSLIVFPDHINMHEVSQRIEFYKGQIGDLVGAQLHGFLYNESIYK